MSTLPQHFMETQVKIELLEMLSLLSSHLYLLPLDESDFSFGEWTALNVNNENVILKYIALAALKSPSHDHEDIWKTFYETFPMEVMKCLKEDFEKSYANDAVSAHNVGIAVIRHFERLSTYMAIWGSATVQDQKSCNGVYYWLVINAVEIAENDWS